MNEQISPVLWHIADGVGHITLNRPSAANAINSAFAEAFSTAVTQAVRADAGAILISSTGKQFCAGGDIREFAEKRDQLDRLVQTLLDWLNPALATLASIPVPVISAVQGPLGGAGIAVALCADIVVASSDIKLRGGYSAIGLSPDLGASFFLARRSSSAYAKYLLMSNKVVLAEECLQRGLVDELVAPETLAEVSRTMAVALARGATGALGGIKRLCDQAATNDLVSHLNLERQALLRCAVSSDAQEGINAFLDKRAPKFTDNRLP